MVVAAFFGSPAMNFVARRVAQDGQSFALLAGASVAIAPPPQAARNRPVVSGVRPEHIVMDAAGGAPAEVAVVEPPGLGDPGRRHARRDAGELYLQGARAPGDRPEGLSLLLRRGTPLQTLPQVD